MNPTLDVRNLRKSFGGLHVIKDVTLQVPPRGKHAIIGPNGAGKSTLFNLITGWHAPDSGEVLFEGRNVLGMPSHKIAALGITRGFQVSKIFHDLTVRENVRAAVHAKGRRTLDLWSDARALGIHKTEQVACDCGLADRLDLLAGTLSQGDKKKLELAMAVAGEPKLLLLDEPTAGMSVQETAETMHLVDNLCQRLELAILFTEHDMGVVFNLAHKVSLLHRGQILVTGTSEEVRCDETVGRVYLGEEVA